MPDDAVVEGLAVDCGCCATTHLARHAANTTVQDVYHLLQGFHLIKIPHQEHFQWFLDSHEEKPSTVLLDCHNKQKQQLLKSKNDVNVRAVHHCG